MYLLMAAEAALQTHNDLLMIHTANDVEYEPVYVSLTLWCVMHCTEWRG